jgi:hypothetical protein
VNITKLATPAPDALRVALVKQKLQLALQHRIVFVLKTFVPVPTAIRQLVQHVLHTVPIFVRLVPVSITKLATHALGALRVVSEHMKRLLALRHRIVFVLKTFVLVPTALKQRAQHVLPTMPIFVRRVPVNITKLAIPALDVLRVALEK